MNNSVKIILGALLMFCPLLKAKTINYLLRQTIGGSAEESWEYSANGGYIFEAEMDLIGDDKPEKMVWFSIDGYGPIHIFDSSNEQKYLGKLDRRLLGSPMMKEAEKLTIFSISDSGNYPSEGEKAFTKKVLSTVISKEGIETLERVAGVGPGDIEDKQFNEIRNGSIRLEGAVNFEPRIKFTSLRSYLNDNSNWAEFRKAEWVEMDSYLIHQDDVAAVQKIKSSSDDDEIPSLLGGFPKDQALKLLGSLELGRERDKSIERNVRKEVEGRERDSSNQHESKQIKSDPRKKPFNLLWIIAGVLLAGILVLLLKIFKGKTSASSDI